MPGRPVESATSFPRRILRVFAEEGMTGVFRRVRHRLSPPKTVPKQYRYPHAPRPRPMSTVSLPRFATEWIGGVALDPPLDLNLSAIAEVLKRARTDPEAWGLLGQEGISEPQVGETLYAVTRWTRPKSIIEVGGYSGVSSLCLALACLENDQGHVHVMEPVARHRELIRRHLEAAGMSSWITIHNFDSAAAARIESLPESELIFLDADHSYDATARDIKAFGQKLTPSSMLILHDSVKFLDVRRVVAEVVASGQFDVLTVATADGDGLSLMRLRLGITGTA